MTEFAAEFNTALLMLRVWVGAVMLTHGVKHLRGREKTTNWLRAMGYQKPEMQWIGMSFGEIAAGLGIMLGLLTSLATAVTAAIMVVAYLTVHRAAGFWVTARPEEGWEYVATLLAGATTIAMLGPGQWAVDEALGLAADLDGWIGLALVGGGAAAGIGQVATFFRPSSTTS
jgi:putative oxidoreductase